MSRGEAVGSRTAERIGLTCFPIMTVVMVSVLVVMAVLQVIEPEVLGQLGRTSAGLHGDWWRSVTALFVQDGGVAGTVSNVLFLALVGALAEQVLSRPRWLIHYFGVGVLTEFVAYVLQPVGGGNSIAVCGLTGAVALAAWHRDTRLPRSTAPILVIWVGALVATVPALAIPTVVVAAIATAVLIRYQQDHEPAIRPAALVVGTAGVLLTALGNIHGVALLAGLVLAAFTLGRPAVGNSTEQDRRSTGNRLHIASDRREGDQR